MNKANKRRKSDALSDISIIHDKWIDVDGRQMWIHSIESEPDGGEPGVEYMMANHVIKNLHILLKSNAKAPVIIHLHACGGVDHEGFAIYDAIKLMPYRVTMISYTHARSMSSVILQAADNRILLPHSYFLFHDGEMCASGTVKAVRECTKFSYIHSGYMKDIYADRLCKKGKFKGCNKEYIKRELQKHMDKKEDVYLTAEEAIEWGFADKILTKFPV
jgi:ATP-dependent protease ClpP protease subunit